MQCNGPGGFSSGFILNAQGYPLLAPTGTYRVTLKMQPTSYLPQFANM